METSTLISSTQPSVPSPDGLHIATLHTTHLSVRNTSTLDLVHSFDLPSRRSKFVNLRWSPPSLSSSSSSTSSDLDPSFAPPTTTTNNSAPTPLSTRILLATTDSVLVFSLTNSAFRATINNGSGGLGPISHADFGCDEYEVMVWTSMGASVCVWSLETGRMVAELKDPKFFGSAAAIAKGCGWSREARADAGDVGGNGVSSGSGSGRGVFALLTRPGTEDIITLYAGKSWSVIKSWTCDTLDAQGLKWSPDGRWLALWDAASMGYKAQVYTADGHCFRTYHGDYFSDELRGLGVKRVEWEPNGMWLALASWEQGVTLLDTRKVIPAMRLAHPRTITASAELAIFQEIATSTSQRSYQELTNPTSPPTASPSTSTSTSIATSSTSYSSTAADIAKAMPQGTSLLSFSPSGDLLATKDDSMPTAVYIWAFSGSLSLRAVLLHHSIVTKLAWAPPAKQYKAGANPAERLLMTCEAPAQTLSQAQSQTQVRHVHLYDAATNHAHILSVPMNTNNTTGTSSMGPRIEASWLPRSSGVLMLGGQQGFMLVWPDGKKDDMFAEESESRKASMWDVGSQGNGEHGEHGEEEDSVFDITTGLQAAELGEDTFHNKRVAGVMA